MHGKAYMVKTWCLVNESSNNLSIGEEIGKSKNKILKNKKQNKSWDILGE